MVRDRLAARLFAAGALVCLVLGELHGQRIADPRPLPAVAAILGAFDAFPLVAIGEAHRNQQVHDFIVTLLRDPRFQEKVNDVVVEFGNARYQDVADRYSSGDAVAPAQLRLVWRDTVNSLVWDAPVYERVFTTVRAINQRRPPARRLRVLLADPPIDWATIRGRDEWLRVAASRDAHAAALVEREVLSKGRRALLIFGSDHVTRDAAFDSYGAKPGRMPTLAELLEQRHPGAAFLVWCHMSGWMTSELDPRLAAWPTPALARLQSTWLGATHLGPPSQTPRLQDVADGFLYLGSTRTLTLSVPPIETYRDPAYMQELIRRNEIQGGINTSELEALRRRLARTAK